MDSAIVGQVYWPLMHALADAAVRAPSTWAALWDATPSVFPCAVCAPSIPRMVARVQELSGATLLQHAERGDAPVWTAHLHAVVEEKLTRARFEGVAAALAGRLGVQPRALLGAADAVHAAWALTKVPSLTRVRRAAAFARPSARPSRDTVVDALLLFSAQYDMERPLPPQWVAWAAPLTQLLSAHVPHAANVVRALKPCLREAATTPRDVVAALARVEGVPLDSMLARVDAVRVPVGMDGGCSLSRHGSAAGADGCE